jgi:predicted class III extradiol MEMO1 family dioxygenase
MQALQRCASLRHVISFTQYDQSHRCIDLKDSSVSYASAVITIDGTAPSGNT